MGFWQRIKSLFSSNLGALLDSAEDPELALDQIVKDMNGELHRTKAFLAEAIVNMKKLERDEQKHRQLGLDYREKAKIILSDDDESNDYLAKEALLRQKENEGLAESYHQAFLKQKESVDALRRNIDKMAKKMHEAKAKKSMLLAKKQIADTQAHIVAATSTEADGQAFAEFKRIEEKIDDLATHSEVRTEMSREADVDSQLEEIEFGHDVDLELESLKKELLLEAGESAKQLPES